MTRSVSATRILLALVILTELCAAQYFGKDLGKLTELHHGVSGHVYAVDSKTLFIKDFTYDGEGPAAYFYVGNSREPGASGGTRLRDERGAATPLRRYRGRDLVLALPDGLPVSGVRWFSVWCDDFSVNFGDIRVPKNLDVPKPQKTSALSGVHGVSSDVVIIVDAQTLLVPHFSYDGEAPDAKFWVGRGGKPSPQGIRIPDENGKEAPLRKYEQKTIVLSLPGDLTVFDIGHFGVWCEAFTVDFGHIRIPDKLNVPPSLKMLGVSPQSKLNCEVLYDELAFEVRWAVAGDSIVLQLVAKLEDGEYMSFGLSGDARRSQMVGGDVVVAWVDKDTLKGYAYDYYLDAKSQCAGVRGSCPDERLGEKTNSVRLLNAAMVNGYSIVTYQRSLRAMDELDLPVNTNGSQPIIWAIGPLNSRNEVSYHSSYLKTDQFLDFGRPPMWNCPMPETEDEQDQQENSSTDNKKTNTNNGQYLTETSQRQTDVVEYDTATRIDLNKQRAVPPPKPVKGVAPWEIPAIQCNEPADGVFYAQMGPTGGKQGYPAITGHVGWGISWYINGLLIPEINVVRGKKYTFVVEGGYDPSIPARYHPFYITDDSIGGYEHRSPEEKANIKIFAGIRRTRSGEMIPTGVGRLCNWTPDSEGPGSDEYPSFGSYQRSLTLICDEGNPGVITWIPDDNTPDTVYYQCFTHRYLGWKINVLDYCDEEEAESKRIESVIRVDAKLNTRDDLLEGEEDLESNPSIQVSTRIQPDTNFLGEQRRKLEKNDKKHFYNNIENHNMNPNTHPNKVLKTDKKPYSDDTLTGEINYKHEAQQTDVKTSPLGVNQLSDHELPLSRGQLKHVIETVESMEQRMKNHPEEKRPVYHHSTTPIINKDSSKNLNKDGSNLERPVWEVEELVIEPKDQPSSMMLPPNQKPMTLQTFMRPQGKPVKGMNHMYRRPSPPEIKNRRPINNKPHNNFGMRARPPTSYHNGQGGPVMQHKKPIFKGTHNNNNNNNNNNNGPQHNRTPNGGAERTKNSPVIITPKPINTLQQNVHNKGTQSIIIGKPNLITQTLTLGQPTIIGQQIVHSHMTIPSDGEVKIENSGPSFLNKPGQIILGKPMENPVPLDQQMIQSNVHALRHPASTTVLPYYSSTIRNRPSVDYPTQPPLKDLASSELIGVSEAAEDIATLPPAVNTGFKPDSIVIESGFKPIIREPLMANEDRITDYVPDSINRRSDVDVDDQYIDTVPQPLFNSYYSEQLTQTFEPIFIPSPLDRSDAKGEKIKTTPVKLSPNVITDDKPRPVYVKPTIDEPLSKKNTSKDSDDMAMEADRVHAYYLPPDPKHAPKEEKDSKKDTIPEDGTFVTYDGQTVSASTLTGGPPTSGNKVFSAKLSSNAELLTRTPQFGPFRGDIPAIIADELSSKNDLQKEASANDSDRVTHLKLVNTVKDKDDIDVLKPEESIVDEILADLQNEEDEEDVDDEEYDESEGRRIRREVSPENEHQHTENTHQHKEHDHHHDHYVHSAAICLSLSPLFYSVILSLTVLGNI